MHRRHAHSQVTLVEPPGGQPYLVYQADLSKINQGEIKHMKRSPKEVTHFANQKDPLWCLLQLYKEYSCHGPVD